MTKRSNHGGQPPTASKRDPARLAEALRANLRRRKDQARGRARDPSSDPTPAPAPKPVPKRPRGGT